MTKLGEIIKRANTQLKYLGVDDVGIYNSIRQCRRAEQVLQIMGRYGWEDELNLFNCKRYVRYLIKNENGSVTKYEVNKINQCESFVQIKKLMKSFNFSDKNIQKCIEKYTEIKPYKYI